ncbi:hypothetical protein B0H11DRAFT_2246647 [Mycena galericulata]|nr:hypothetical protein B0H11DRAFT_2246647 [Mycena galericulata]
MELLRGTNPGCAFLVKTYGEGIFDTPVGNFFWESSRRGHMRPVNMLLGLASENNRWDLVMYTNERAGSPRLPGTLSAYLFQLGLYSDALSLCQKWFDPQNPPKLGGTAFDPPHRAMVAGNNADDTFARRNVENGVQGAVLHTAAIAHSHSRETV